jgi:hypothetical protein
LKIRLTAAGQPRDGARPTIGIGAPRPIIENDKTRINRLLLEPIPRGRNYDLKAIAKSSIKRLHPEETSDVQAK